MNRTSWALQACVRRCAHAIARPSGKGLIQPAYLSYIREAQVQLDIFSVSLELGHLYPVYPRRNLCHDLKDDWVPIVFLQGSYHFSNNFNSIDVINLVCCWCVEFLHPWARQKFAKLTKDLHLQLSYSTFVDKVMLKTWSQSTTWNCTRWQELQEEGVMLHQLPADVEQNMESVTTVAWQDASWQIVIIKKDDKSFWITLPIFVSHFDDRIAVKTSLGVEECSMLEPAAP